jgi:hypothetical protein
MPGARGKPVAAILANICASRSGRSKLRQASCGRSWSVMVALSEYKSPELGRTIPKPACHSLHGAATKSRLIRTWAMTWSETTRASPSLRWRILRNSSSMAEPAMAAIGCRTVVSSGQTGVAVGVSTETAAAAMSSLLAK